MTPPDQIWNDLPWIRDDQNAGTQEEGDVLSAASALADRLETDDPLEIMLGGVTGRRRIMVSESLKGTGRAKQILAITVHEDVRGLKEARTGGDPAMRSLAASLLRRAVDAPAAPGAWGHDPVALYAGAVTAHAEEQMCEIGMRVSVRLPTPILPGLGTYENAGRGRIAVLLPTTIGGAVFLTMTDGLISLNENGMSLKLGPFDAMERMRLAVAAQDLPTGKATFA